ncbi:N/A [soil metagenome]
MPFYQYTALDASGKKVKGSLQAVNPSAAESALGQAGLRSVVIASPNSIPQPPVRATASMPQQPILRQPAAPAPKPVVRTPKGSDKDRFFLFSQMGAAFRAGINSAQIFDSLSQRGTPKFRESLEVLSRETGEGRPISDIMERYPDLYPSPVVGLVRAGEQGGFLPDALEEVSIQAENAHKFRRFFVWVYWVAVNTLLSIPLVLVFTRAMLVAYDEVDKSGGQMDMGAVLGVIGKAMIQNLIWPWGPIFAIIYGGMWLLKRYIESDDRTMLRHRWGMKWPVLGARARQENFTAFSWTMARLSRAGLPPARSWQMAANAVPNIYMRDLLNRAGTGWLEGREKLSDLIHQSGVFPEEYAPMVYNAELTGDIPGAMDRLAGMSRDQFVSATAYAKLRSSAWGCLAMVATGGIIMIILSYFWYHELFNKILGGFEILGPICFRK